MERVLGERTAKAEVEVARARRARGADVNFMVLLGDIDCLNKNDDVRSRVAFIFHVLGRSPRRRGGMHAKHQAKCKASVQQSPRGTATKNSQCVA